MNVHVIGRPGSDYRKKIDNWLGNVPRDRAQCVFNYGLQGGMLDDYLARYPNILDIPNLNMHQFGNKYESVKAVRDAGMPAPESRKWRERDFFADYDNLIVKPYYSLGGRNIRRIHSFDEVTEDEQRSHYLQKEITNRRYELRCICASWIDPNEWLFMKRVHDRGEIELAWNHHNGGRFITVNDPTDPLFDRVREDVKKMLPLFGYQFGAVDFIIQNNPGGKLKHFFIEWNLAPGWSIPNTENWMKRMCATLKECSLEDIECFENGLLAEDVANGKPPERGGLFGIQFDEPPEFEPPDWHRILMRNDQEGETMMPDNICYSNFGGIMLDTADNMEKVNQAGLNHIYSSIRCLQGHLLLVRIDVNYTGFCPACGDEIRLEA